MTKILIGADPEAFIALNGKPMSAHDTIPGTKEKPHPVEGLGSIQVDGMAVEFNVEPTDNVDVFVQRTRDLMAHIEKILAVPRIIDLPSVHFSKDIMAATPRDALRLGCEPDFCSYTLAENPRPRAHPRLRTAGGHVHLGWSSNLDPTSPAHRDACAGLVGLLDHYLGVPSVLLDKDRERRQLYGAAGAFRPKPYGVEYRTLSNFWIHNPALIKWVFEQSQKAYRSWVEGDMFFGADEIINTSDEDAAFAYIAEHGITPPTHGSTA